MFIPRQYQPTGSAEKSIDPAPIEDFFDARMLVVLGDPGQGKTEAFKHAAQVEPDAVFVPLRKFLHGDVERWRSKVLYLDGLDEQRAKLKDRDILAEIVARLEQLGCPKVRISCRTPDWHGGSDISLLNDVAQGDTVRQAMLLPLADGDIRRIIQDRGMEPDSFMAEAEARDIASLFGNPQLLELFIETINGGRGWPATRKELMESAIALMMQEINEDHDRVVAPLFPDFKRLQMAADRMAALILLSGQEGVALGRAGREAGYVDIGEIGGEWADAMQVAGRRKVFRADEPEQAAPRHRTLAEFMAARHLAHLVHQGLPLRRILTLVTGVDGGTLSDLRGLYAWLVAFLPEHADILLQQDPLGAIHYGDAASWPVPVRRQALKALRDRDKIDPYYRSQLWSRQPLAGLPHPDLAGDFHAILSQAGNSTTLRLAVDALAVGPPIPALADDLMTLIGNQSCAFHIRKAAIDAFTNVDPSRLRDLIPLLDDLNAGRLTDERHQMRQGLIEALYPAGLSLPELMPYLAPRGGDGDEDYDAFDDFGYHIGHVIMERTRDVDLPALADLMGDPSLPPRKRRCNWWQYLLTSLFRRMIANGDFAADPQRLERWLRLSEDDEGHVSLDTDCRKLLYTFFSEHPALVQDLFRIWLDRPDTDPDHWRWEFWRFQERLGFSPLPMGFGLFVLEVLATNQDEKWDIPLFKIATDVLIAADQPATGWALESLFAFGEEHPRLTSILADTMTTPVLDWKIKEAERAKEHREKSQNWREKKRQWILSNAEPIRTGQNFAELDWAATLWLGYFSDVDQDISPRERLVTTIGEDSTNLMLEGMNAILSRNDWPDLSEHLRLESEEKRHYLSYALPVALDHRFQTTADFAGIPDAALHSALAAHFVVDHGRTKRSWVQAIIKDRPDIAHPLLSALWRNQLDRGCWPSGLHAMNDSDLPLSQALRMQALDLLAHKPDVDAEILEPLLRACAQRQPNDLCALARSILPTLNDTAAVTWASEAVRHAPEEFASALERHAKASTEGLWSLRFAAEALFGQWPIQLQSKVLHILLAGLPPVPTTLGVRTVGVCDPEDASRVMSGLIDKLAKRKEPEAGIALAALRDDLACIAWRNSLAHAVCVQAQVRRDAEFDYATLDQVSTILSNGTPTTHRDLQALLLDHLDSVAVALSCGNSDGWRHFWNTENGKTTTPKWEGDGRDYLMDLMKPLLAPKSVSIGREGDFAAHKRADLVAYHDLKKLPIEIKRNFHSDVWNAMDWQLSGQYAADPACQGYGIYLVLWFDGQPIPTPPDSLGKPTSAEEMERTLRIVADRAALGDTITIRVLDCGKSGS